MEEKKMKKLKVLLSVLLSAMLVLSMAAPAFAEDPDTIDSVGPIDGGAITITNAKDEQTYKVYQLLYLESFAGGSAPMGAYKVTAPWTAFFNGDGATYVEEEDGGYIKFKEYATDEDEKQAIQEFVAKAKNFIDANPGTVKPVAITEATENGPITFNGLKLGWYLVDSTLGTLCSIDTTKPTVEITEKNDLPGITKLVKEDSENAFLERNTAKIGQEVEFKITVAAKKGAQGYIVKDIMDAGLSFNNNIVIKVGDVALDAREDQNDADYDYSVALNQKIDETTYTFVITFEQEYLDTITGNTDIVITYSAILNEDASIDNANENTATLVYGENPDFVEDTTETFTYEVDIVKHNDEKKVLQGAQFELYEGNTKLAFVDKGNGEYIVSDNAQGTVSVLIVPASGKIKIKGLDKGDLYSLKEIKAPDGYNLLQNDVNVILDDNGSNRATITNGTYVEGGIGVLNKAGTLLPSTGGTGTKVLFTVGGIMMVVAFVLITSKRRMAAEK